MPGRSRPAAPPGACAPINCVDDVGTFSALTDLRQLGVKTFVVGLGVTEQAAPTISQMAVQGGAARATGTTWFDGSNEEALLNSLEDIAERTLACRLVVDAALARQAAEAGTLEVRRGDSLIPRDVERRDH